MLACQLYHIHCEYYVQRKNDTCEKEVADQHSRAKRCVLELVHCEEHCVNVSYPKCVVDNTKSQTVLSGSFCELSHSLMALDIFAGQNGEQKINESDNTPYKN